MGTLAVLASSTVKFSPGFNLFVYALIWAICLAGLGVVLWAALRSKRWPRWTTQDILIVAALGVLLEVYDNVIGDQFITPLLGGSPNVAVNEGATLLIAGGFLIVVSALMWILARRKDQGDQRES